MNNPILMIDDLPALGCCINKLAYDEPGISSIYFRDGCFSNKLSGSMSWVVPGNMNSPNLLMTAMTLIGLSGTKLRFLSFSLKQERPRK
jgi:hypothetical protein